jgi:hypothetical protein
MTVTNEISRAKLMKNAAALLHFMRSGNIIIQSKDCYFFIKQSQIAAAKPLETHFLFETGGSHESI